MNTSELKNKLLDHNWHDPLFVRIKDTLYEITGIYTDPIVDESGATYWPTILDTGIRKLKIKKNK